MTKKKIVKIKRPSRMPDYTFNVFFNFWFDEMIMASTYSTWSYTDCRLTVKNGVLCEGLVPFVGEIQQAYIDWVVEKELLR